MRRLVVALLLVACGATAPERVAVEVGGVVLHLELALDPESRYRGLSGRDLVPRDGGLLFVYPAPRVIGAVMRDCAIPLDVAFLDPTGRVVALHAMGPEPPRRPDESAADYEARLPPYWSGRPAQFALETASGRLFELGLRVGDRVGLDAPALVGRAR